MKGVTRKRSTWGVLVLFLAVAVLSGCGVERLTATELRAGVCFDDQDFDRITAEGVQPVPCGEPHDNEVFLVENRAGEQDARRFCQERVQGRAIQGGVDAVAVVVPIPADPRTVTVACIGFRTDYQPLTHPLA